MRRTIPTPKHGHVPARVRVTSPFRATCLCACMHLLLAAVAVMRLAVRDFKPSPGAVSASAAPDCMQCDLGTLPSQTTGLNSEYQLPKKKLDEQVFAGGGHAV